MCRLLTRGAARPRAKKAHVAADSASSIRRRMVAKRTDRKVSQRNDSQALRKTEVMKRNQGMAPAWPARPPDCARLLEPKISVPSGIRRSESGAPGVLPVRICRTTRGQTACRARGIVGRTCIVALWCFTYGTVCDRCQKPRDPEWCNASWPPEQRSGGPIPDRSLEQAIGRQASADAMSLQVGGAIGRRRYSNGTAIATRLRDVIGRLIAYSQYGGAGTNYRWVRSTKTAVLPTNKRPLRLQPRFDAGNRTH